MIIAQLSFILATYVPLRDTLGIRSVAFYKWMVFNIPSMPLMQLKGVEYVHLPSVPEMRDYTMAHLRSEVMRQLADVSYEVSDVDIDGNAHPNNAGYPLEMGMFLGSQTLDVLPQGECAGGTDCPSSESLSLYPDLGSEEMERYYGQIVDIIEQSS